MVVLGALGVTETVVVVEVLVVVDRTVVVATSEVLVVVVAEPSVVLLVLVVGPAAAPSAGIPVLTCVDPPHAAMTMPRTTSTDARRTHP